jgi:hypothetical protein
MKEQVLNKFVEGQKIAHVRIYENSIQIWMENGAFIAASADDKIKVRLEGPDPPEREIMREMWDASIELV